ncbi:MAG: hypothetical protein ACJ77K_13450 [Bacteroidia bacterium]
MLFLRSISIKIILFGALLFFSSIADSQVNTFHKQFPLWNESSMNNFQQTADSGYIVASDAVFEMDSTSASPVSYFSLFKIDRFGNVEWHKRFPKSLGAIKG